MRPPPRGMTRETVAVLAASVPVSLAAVALTAALLAGLTLTVMSVCNGRLAQLTTMRMGLFCCAESTASGVDNPPVGEAETGTPPTLVTVNCAACPFVEMIMG